MIELDEGNRHQLFEDWRTTHVGGNTDLDASELLRLSECDYQRINNGTESRVT